jgi:DNA-binding XRE family transcriptional regulator
MSVQYIHQNGQKNGLAEYAVIPVKDYQVLLKKAEMLDDITDFDKAVARDEETLPDVFVEQLLNAKSKIAVWRQYRGMSQEALSEAAGVAQAYISQIENGKRKAGLRALLAIAGALGVDVDDLI